MEKPKDSDNKDLSLKKYKILVRFLIGVIIVLVVLLIYTGNRINTVVIERNDSEALKLELQDDLNLLIQEHEKIKSNYGELSDKLTEKDSIILAKAEEIQNLINYKANYYSTRKKLDLLRNITQGYVHQIDSLYKVTKELQDENIKITKNYTAEKAKTEELTKVAKEQGKTIEIASELKAYNVSANGLRIKSGSKKEILTDKARRIKKVKVCFTLSENAIAEPGPRTIYIRIARPDNKIISEGDAELYSFMHEGKRVQYSMKKEIEYANKAMNICLYWTKKDNKTPAMTGTYNVAVFCENYEIGQSSFILD
ncbi:hypothetical protein ACFL6I_12825 [candidate division KSB1 bacterium]